MAPVEATNTLLFHAACLRAKLRTLLLTGLRANAQSQTELLWWSGPFVLIVVAQPLNEIAIRLSESRNVDFIYSQLTFPGVSSLTLSS